MESKELAPTLIDSLTDFDPTQITPDLAELALDHILDNGIIRDIPVVRSFYAVYKTTVALRDRALIKKIIRFLFSLNKVSSEERSKFKEKIEKDDKFKKKVGEHLLLILDRLDDMDKPYLVAHAFGAFEKGLIDYEAFQRLALAIDKTFYPDLISFNANHDYKQLSTNTILNLVSSGILELEAMPSIKLSAKNNKYRITELGKQLLDLVFKE